MQAVRRHHSFWEHKEKLILVSVCLLKSWSMMLFVCTSLQASNFHGNLAWLHGTQNVSLQMGQVSLLGVVNYFPGLKQKMFLKINYYCPTAQSKLSKVESHSSWMLEVHPRWKPLPKFSFTSFKVCVESLVFFFYCCKSNPFNCVQASWLHFCLQIDYLIKWPFYIYIYI